MEISEFYSGLYTREEVITCLCETQGNIYTIIPNGNQYLTLFKDTKPMYVNNKDWIECFRLILPPER